MVRIVAWGVGIAFVDVEDVSFQVTLLREDERAVRTLVGMAKEVHRVHVFLEVVLAVVPDESFAANRAIARLMSARRRTFGGKRSQ